MVLQKTFYDKSLAAGDAEEDDAPELSRFFSTITNALPASQRDKGIEALKETLTGENLLDFIHDDERAISLVALVDGKIAGAIFGMHETEDVQADAGWRDPADNVRILWYGVAPEHRGISYNITGQTIRRVLFEYFQHEVPVRFDCHTIEALNHIENPHGRAVLNAHGYQDMGGLVLNLDAENPLPHNAARYYNRFRLSLSQRLVVH